MKTAMRRLLASLGVVAALTASSDAVCETEPLAPEALNSAADSYDGKIVRVRGYLVLKPTARVLYQSKELNDELRRRWTEPGFSARSFDKYCLTLLNAEFLEQNRDIFDGQTVVISGRFKSSYLDGTILDMQACAFPTALVLDDADVKRLFESLR